MADIPNMSLARDGVLKRALLLYGLHALLFNIFFVFAYYVLPETICLAVGILLLVVAAYRETAMEASR